MLFRSGDSFGDTSWQHDQLRVLTEVRDIELLERFLITAVLTGRRPRDEGSRTTGGGIMDRWGSARRAGAVIVATLAFAALLPLGATAADQEPVTIDTYIAQFSGVTVTELNPNRIQVNYLGGGMASSSSFLFGCESGGAVEWKYNPDTTSGTVSGSLAIGGGCIPDAEPISWDGDFHGRLTPDGASGVLRMTSDTGLRLRATWMSPGAVDPTVGTLQMSVSGVVTGDV